MKLQTVLKIISAVLEGKLYCLLINEKGEKFPMESKEEFEQFLFEDKGRYMKLSQERPTTVISHSPFEKGLCLN